MGIYAHKRTCNKKKAVFALDLMKDRVLPKKNSSTYIFVLQTGEIDLPVGTACNIVLWISSLTFIAFTLGKSFEISALLLLYTTTQTNSNMSKGIGKIFVVASKWRLLSIYPKKKKFNFFEFV